MLRLFDLSFFRQRLRTNNIMSLVIFAALPGIAAQWYYFGWGNLFQIILAIFFALLTESIALKLRNLPVTATLADNSALLTALLLGISIPPLAPWWIIAIGTIFAIIIVKQLYGGLGQNPFNPAMAGYVVLFISFPVQMTSWLPAFPFQAIKPGFIDTLAVIFNGHTRSGLTMYDLSAGIDGITQATPLNHFKTALAAGQQTAELLTQPFYTGLLGSPGWQWVNAGFLLGGLFLLARGTIRWQIPLSFLLALWICAYAGWLVAPDKLLPPLIHLFSGATMLGAFFIATDPVTASTTNNGRLIFGALTGVLTWLIRSFGGYPDGVAFAVLLANICVPLLDYYTQPRVYGHDKD